jgi:fluoride ion exporter CrcB/FEX
MESTTAVVVWALPLGGLMGAIARIAIRQRIEFPYFERAATTGQLIGNTGFLGELLLGPIAAFAICGAAASTFSFR